MPLMVSAAAAVGVIVRRETRGGTGRVANQTRARPRPRRSRDAAATGVTTRRHSGRAWQRRSRCRADRCREARGLLQDEQRGGDVGHTTPAILGETTLKKRPNRRRDLRGERRPVGLDLQHVASVSLTSSPSNGRLPVSISYSTQPNAQMSLRLSTGSALRLLRRHIRRRAEHHANTGRHRGTGDRRRRATSPVRCAVGSSAFARPKSRTFTVPSGRTLMFAGFRSRWMIPARAPLRAPRRSVSRSAAPRRSGSARARCAVTSPRPRRVPSRAPSRRRLLRARRSRRCSDDSARRGLRFALEAGEPSASAASDDRQDLDRDVALQLRVARAIHLAHTAGPKGGKDFVRAKACAGVEGQTAAIEYTGRAARRLHYF